MLLALQPWLVGSLRLPFRPVVAHSPPRMPRIALLMGVYTPRALTEATRFPAMVRPRLRKSSVLPRRSMDTLPMSKQWQRTRGEHAKHLQPPVSWRLSYLTTVTGTCAKWMTFVVTEPSNRPAMAEAPPLPMMIVSQPISAACRAMVWATSPTRILAV